MGASSAEKDTAARSIGRYVLFREIAHGGMATVHLGRLRGPAGFSRTVAIKRLHPQFARDPEFVTMFLDEARLAARIQHPNVVSVLDVVAAEGELFLVMDYVHGESLAKLAQLLMEQKKAPPPSSVVLPLITNVLYGLHAAHEARSERGDPLNIVHRDVTPHNVLVGVDGVARVLDFGIAKATLGTHVATRDGQLKGKVPYMSPEQIGGLALDRRADVYSAAVILWEALTGQRLFTATDMISLATAVVSQKHDPPSARVAGISPELDAIVMKALAKAPEERYATAREMALALEAVGPHATPPEIGEWAMALAGSSLSTRAQSIAEIEGAALPAVHVNEGAVMPFPTGVRDSLKLATLAAQGARQSSSDESSAPGTAGPDDAVALPMRRPSKRAMAIAAGALAVVIAGAAATCAVGGGSSTKPASAASAQLPATTSASPVAIAPVPAPVPEPPPAPAPSPAPSPSPSPAPAPAHRPAARPAANRPNCNPPYTIDANGVRIPKRYCF